MSKIEWTDRTWNPLAGCTMVSRACEWCYAMRMAFRLEQMGQEKYKGTTRKTEGGKIVWTGKINLDEKALLAPLKWKKPQRVFVDSMSDLFHENVAFDFIDKVFAVMALTPHITYQILTKRYDRMEEYFNEGRFENIERLMNQLHDLYIKPLEQALYFEQEVVEMFPLPNVWLGVTIENQKAADERIPPLLRCPAVVRFVSCEPLVGPIDLKPFLKGFPETVDEVVEYESTETLPKKIHWVIAGGESGPNAEPSHPDWFRSLRDQCIAAGVPFFFKQWGEWVDSKHTEGQQHQLAKYMWIGRDGSKDRNLVSPFPNETVHYNLMVNTGKKAAGNLLDGQVWEQFPETGGNEGENGIS